MNHKFSKAFVFSVVFLFCMSTPVVISLGVLIVTQFAIYSFKPAMYDDVSCHRTYLSIPLEASFAGIDQQVKRKIFIWGGT